MSMIPMTRIPTTTLIAQNNPDDLLLPIIDDQATPQISPLWWSTRLQPPF